MRVVDCEYDSNEEPVSVTCEDDGEYYTFHREEVGHWVYAVRKGRYPSWEVSAECPNCHNGVTILWRGNFPSVPDEIAESVALQSAKSAYLYPFCPYCGMKLEK